jgi:hypothetical protein
MVMILAPPAGDAFNFVVNLAVYPSQAFSLALAVGLYLVRYERKKAGLARPDFRAWDVAIIFSILVNIYCLVMPWYPPPRGKDGGEFTFWYAAYVVTVLECKSFPNNTLFSFADLKFSLILCVVYYVVWMYVLPYLGKYTVRQETTVLDDEGTNTHRLVKVPNDKVAGWDAAHDPTGKPIEENVDYVVNGGEEKNEKSV